MPPSEKEIKNALVNYNFTVKVLFQILAKVEKKNSNDKRWFTFSEKVGRKYFLQANTLLQLFGKDVELLLNKDKQVLLDFSSLYSLLRVQMETYAVFFHLFADNCNVEEKRVRFHLWELDGLKTKHSYARPDDEELNKALDEEMKHSNGIPEMIYTCPIICFQPI